MSLSLLTFCADTHSVNRGFFHSLSVIALSLLFSFLSNFASAQQCTDIFTNGVSSNNSGGSVELSWRSELTSGGATIDTPSLTDGSGWNACNGAACTASGLPAESSNPTFQTGTGADGAISVGFRGNSAVSEGDYTNINVDTRGELSMTTVDGVSYMDSVSILFRGHWHLAPGDYWIDGDLYLDTRTEINALGSGQVRIFVNGNVTIRDWFNNNDFAPENFLLYTTGAISASPRVNLNGFFYSASGTTTIGFRSTISGALSGYDVLVENEVEIDYDASALATAEFPPFCSNIPPLPDPIALYHLDERAWSGGAGEVEDSSGNGLDGRAINLGDLPDTDDTNPAIANNPGTCAYGVFDGTSDGYIEIADPGSGSLLDLSSGFSISVWIYPFSLPTGGDLRTIVSKDTNYEFHLNSSGRVFWWWGGGERELTSTSSVTLNTWNHIFLTYESGEQKIYINGSEVASRNSTAALSFNNDSLFIGTDLNFHSRRFNGYIDEVVLYDEKLTAGQVAVAMNETHACPLSVVSHYALSHSGSGLTCQSELVTIVAHDDTHTAVDVDGYVVEVSATSASSGWSVNDASWSLDTGSGSFSIVSPGVAQYQFASGESAVALRLSNTSEALIDIDVEDSLGYTDDDGDPLEDENLSFTDTGFLFFNDADGNGDGDGTPIISSLVSGGSASTILQAVRTDTNTGACVARVQGSYNVDMAYECLNPSSCQLNRDLSVNGTAVEENDFNNISDYQSVSLNFDAEGEATFQFEYFDVGNIRLHARLNLPASGSEPAVTLQGSSDTTTIFPADLYITNVAAPDGSPNPATTTSGSGFVTAGSPFRVTVESRNANGRVTPNFGLETPVENIQLNLSSLVMPAGGNLAALNGASSFSSTATLGQFINTQVNWLEVGTIRLYASTDANYLNAGQVTGSDSGNIGRFYPERYRLSGASLIEGCASGGFTYMSDSSRSYEPLSINFSIDAISSATVLSNYDQALGYPVGSISLVAENNNNGVDLSGRAFIASSNFSAGVYQVNGRGGFTRSVSASGEIPDGPYANVQLGILASGGADNVNFASSDLNMHSSQANNCSSDGDCNAVTLASAINVVFARLAASNAHGPESAPLTVPLNIEYWNGVEFVQNVNDDNCTQINLSDIQFSGNAINVDSNRTVSVGSGSSTGSFTNFFSGSHFTFANGESGLEFSPPGVGNTGSFSVDVDLTNYGFLRFDWDGDGDYADDTTLPSVDIDFGRYRGHDRIIYWREVL